MSHWLAMIGKIPTEKQGTRVAENVNTARQLRNHSETHDRGFNKVYRVKPKPGLPSLINLENRRIVGSPADICAIILQTG